MPAILSKMDIMQEKAYELCDSLRCLIVDDMAFPHLKEAVTLADASVQNILSGILHGEIAGVKNFRLC